MSSDLLYHQFGHGVSVFTAVVVENLQTGGFFDEKVTKSCLFSTIHDAVLHSQSSSEPNEVMYHQNA